MTSTEPPWPLNERDRLSKLREYGVLDTPPEPVFDRLVRLVSRHFGMPIALISLIDETRQWCKACHGIDIAAIERRLSFCAYTILDDAVMVVPDARADERFAEHDLVIGPPGLRFYAGVPLRTPEGLRIGTLAVFDLRPRRDFTSEDAQDLDAFAAIVMDAFEARAARRAAAEAELLVRDNLGLLEGILESATDPIFAKDREGRFTLVNPAAARLFGLPRERIVGMRSTDLFPLYQGARLDALCTRVMATDRAETSEEELPFPGDAGTRTLMIAVTPLHGAAGEGAAGEGVVGVAGVARDITARMRAEEALRASEARFRTLVDQTPLLMWINRIDGTVAFSNAAWRAFTGHVADGDALWDDVHPEDRPRMMAVRGAAIAAGEPYSYEMRLRRADGEWRWHLGRIVPMREAGRLVAWIGTAVEVHDILRAQRLAEEADQSKGRFLAAASHDLRQPMQSILLFAGALRVHVPGETGRHVLDRLQQGLETLKDLLDSLLDVSRLDAGVVAPQIAEFPIADLIDELAAAFAPVAEAKGLDWVTVPCDAVVRSDRILIGRMLRNLVDNAIRYTERGRILVDCRVRGDRLLVAVHDTGIGIAAEQHGRIFEEFHQLGNPERDREQGHGLGLAIVRRLARLLDHPVEVSSQAGAGSVFSVAVPLAAERHGAEPPVLPPEPAPLADMPVSHRKFAVVVEDDAIVMLGLATMLREWGFDVLTSGGTDQALARLSPSGRRPDLVLVDYRLRQGRIGTEAVLRIREMFEAPIPGIIITGEIGPEPQRDATDYGLTLIHKPVTPRLLERAVAAAIGAGISSSGGADRPA